MKCNYRIGLLVGMLAALASGAAHANTVTFDLPDTAVFVGDLFSVDIIGTGFTDSTDGGGVNVTFDSALLAAHSVVLNPIWDVWADPGDIDNTTGSIDGVDFATFDDPASDFVIATVTFTALTAGDTLLDLSESFGIGGWARLGVPQDVNFLGTSLNVLPAPIPVPASAWLLLSGLTGLFAAARRRD